MRYIIGLLFIFSLLSCEKDVFLIVADTYKECSFSEIESSQKVEFSCNHEWSVAVSDSWIHVSPTSGSSSKSPIVLTITCDSNTTYELRHGSVLLSSSSVSETIEVLQNAKTGIIISSKIINVTNLAQTVSINAKSNVEFSIIIDDDCKDWISQAEARSLSENTFLFNIAPNTDYDSREGKIHFVQKDGATTDVTIIQKQYDAFFLNTPIHNFLSYKAQSFEISAWTNISPDVVIDSDWITYKESRGLDRTSIILSVRENVTNEKRVGKVILKGDSLESVLNIIQYGQPIDLSAEGTANCYIVPLKDSYFSLDASVTGKAEANGSYKLNGGVKAKIVWEKYTVSTARSIIDNLEYDSDTKKITFHTNQIDGNLKDGNILVALLDENETILWSWHLWLTNADLNNNFVTFSNGTILMDRYLGATSDDGIGLYYQWGRKDPFASNKYKRVKVDENTGSIEFSIAHPDVFMDAMNEECDWNYEHTLTWSSNKTIYDPCPPGWKVMDYNCLPKWPNEYKAKEEGMCIILDEPICSPSTKFRYTGLLHVAGHIQSTDYGLIIWTNMGGFYRWFYIGYDISTNIYNKDNGFTSSGEGRTYGYCVRCQRE